MSFPKAYVTALAVLESKPLSTVCKNYVDGFCEFMDNCPYSHTHTIQLIDELCIPSFTPILTTCPNVLSFEPRTAPIDNDAYFDNDGPGTLSISQEPRHDNDHVLIQDIQVLPTTDEILSLRRPYMPIKSNEQPHHLPQGPSRQIDIEFRHSRYESTEPIIDLCYHAMQQLFRSKCEDQFIDYQYKLETPRHNRYSLFRNVAFEELSFHETKGTIVRLSYDCPVALQGNKIHRSGLFADGMLCAMIALHEDTNELTTTFFEVYLRQSTDAMKARTGNHSRASLQLTFADKNDTAGVRRCTYYINGLIKASFVLLDLSGVLLAGFALHLDRLQKMAVKPDFAFASQIAPTSSAGPSAISPPAYATGKDFEFNLQDLQAQKHGSGSFTMRTKGSDGSSGNCMADLEALRNKTTLDEGQAVALYESLNRGLAMTQGPPGTGKTFLGVAITQVVLSSQDKADPRPVLLVSQTNRACDDFLSDLLKKGITKIVRLGGGSKEEWVKPYLLREKSNKMKLTQIERLNVKDARIRADNLARDGLGWAEALSKDMLGWHSLKDHIRTHHPAIFEHFASLESYDGDVTDLRRVKRYSGFAYEFWLSGGDINDIDALLDSLDDILGQSEIRQNASCSTLQFKKEIFDSIKRNTEAATSARNGEEIWSLSREDRHKLVARWLEEINPWKVCEAFAELHRRHHAAIAVKKSAMRKIDGRCLAQQEVLGLTTTGVAHHWELLNQLKPRVLLTEEASECLVSHTLCCLFPSIEHALFIGDPLQLRPQVNALTLSTEYSSKYRLDESLFERMMFSESPIPVSKLNVQRRMHPDIADLSRAGDYDYLIDHESTFMHPPVRGMLDRIYWLDHKQPESRPDPRSPMAKSHSNDYEVEFCAALIRYLIERNGYTLGDIVLLTPYNGQLAALANRLRQSCHIYLSEKDREALVELGFLTASDSKIESSKARVDLSSMLRIVTVDNFQGEEAKVIIFSAVRSNNLGKMGFLRTRNRINVACSRARDGFYIVGNASLMNNVEHWAKRIQVFAQKDLIGGSLKVCCDRHPSRVFEVYEPNQFGQVPPCSVICDYPLECGHNCKEQCHPIDMHYDSRISCSGPCEKTLECGHTCLRKCGEPCGGCTVQLPQLILPCGHLLSPTCSETIIGQRFICRRPIEKVKLLCGHIKDLVCSKAKEPFVCEERCGCKLPCGHTCTERCQACKTEGSHPKCKNLCGTYLDCSHTCNAPCHPEKEECPPCNQACSRSCQHGSCEFQCSMICDPCAKPCAREGCAHREACTMICSLPCNHLPCNEPCLNLLSCGIHLCPGLCSEPCLPQCSECTTGLFPDHHQIIHPACGHTFNVEELDTALDLKSLYQVDENGTIEAGGVTKTRSPSMLQCPECRQKIQNMPRYDLSRQLTDLTPTLDRLYAKMGRKLAAAVRDLFHRDDYLRFTFGRYCKDLKPGPLGGKHNQQMVFDRGNHMLEPQQKTIRFRDEVVVPFEDCLCRLTLFLKNSDILGTVVSPFRFRFDVVYYMCRLVTLEDGLKQYKHLAGLAQVDQHTSIIAEGLRVKIIEHCQGELKSLETRIEDAKALHLKRIEAELGLIQTSLTMVLTQLKSDSGRNVKACLDNVRDLCVGYPDTAGKLLFAYRALQSHVEGKILNRGFLGIYDKTFKDLVLQLGNWKIGSLRYCDHHHPYSGEAFPTGCPECGREVSFRSASVPEVDNSQLLQGDTFLAAFASLRSSGALAKFSRRG